MTSRTRLLLALILAVQALLLVWQAWRVGVTFDEPSHLAAATMYWRGDDMLEPSDTPPVMRIASGWIARLAGMPVDAGPAARGATSFEIGRAALAAMDAGDAHRLVFYARLPFVLFPLLITWLLWLWGRELFGTGALVLALFAAFEPTLLAHGALIKSDVPAAAALFFAAHRAWRYARRPDLARAAKLAGAVVAAALTKFTLLVFVPFAIVVFLVWRPVWPRLPRAASFLPAALLVPLLYMGILAAYQFDRVGPIEAQALAKMPAKGFSSFEIRTARILGSLPWPRQFLRGIYYIAEMDRADASFPSYMLGATLESKEPRALAYFPLAWAVKFPIALQLLCLLGFGCAAHECAVRRRWRRAAFVWLPPLILMAFALRSHIHIGFRHVLPCVPFVILGAGFALERMLAARAGRVIVMLAACWLVVASMWNVPRGIAYFNEWAGGARNGWRFLADSNLDWGQDLPDLGRYVERRGLERITLYYFGQDIPAHHVPREKLDERLPPLGPGLAPSPVLDPEPGVYAVSINLLLGFCAAPPYRDFFSAFRGRVPDDRVGYTIFIYEVPSRAR